MIVKLLGFADILAIISLLASNILPQSLVLIMGLYLIGKGVLFIILGGQLPNILDILCGFYILLVSYGISNWVISLIVIFYIGQKAIISLV